MNAIRLVGTNRKRGKINRAEETIISYVMAVYTLRERYQENRLPGENAKDWLHRKSM